MDHLVAAPLTHYALGCVSNELPCDPRVGRSQGVQDPRRAISGARQRLRDNFLSFVPIFDTTLEGFIPVAKAQGSEPTPPVSAFSTRSAPLHCLDTTELPTLERARPQDPASYSRLPRSGLLLDYRLQDAGRSWSRDPSSAVKLWSSRFGVARQTGNRLACCTTTCRERRPSTPPSSRLSPIDIPSANRPSRCYV